MQAQKGNRLAYFQISSGFTAQNYTVGTMIRIWFANTKFVWLFSDIFLVLCGVKLYSQNISMIARKRYPVRLQHKNTSFRDISENSQSNRMLFLKRTPSAPVLKAERSRSEESRWLRSGHFWWPFDPVCQSSLHYILRVGNIGYIPFYFSCYFTPVSGDYFL